MTITQTAYSLDAKINGSSELSISGSVIYDYNGAPNIIDLKVNDPIVCTLVSASSDPLSLLLDDPNNNTISLGSGVLSANYNLLQQTFNISSDESLECATADGLHRETISIGSFELNENDIMVELVNQDEVVFPEIFSFSDDQEVTYKYIITNNGFTQATIDFVEYYRISASQPSFNGTQSDDWTCVEISSGAVTTCGAVTSGNNLVQLNNAVIEPGDQLLVTANRIASIPDGTVGSQLQLLSAVFNKSSSDTIPNNNVAYKSFGTTNNNLPDISAISDQNILEGGTVNELAFTVSDVETAPGDLIMTASSSDTAIVPNTNIVFGGSGANRTVTVTPNTNANTAAGPVTITLTVDDGIATSNELFDINITPVNDRPTFTLVSIPDWPAGSSGLQQHQDFIENLSLGASADEVSQSIIDSSAVIISDPNGIFIQGGEPTITTNGVLSYFLSGRGGSATVGITLQDNGGTDNGGEDTSVEVTFNLTVLNTLPTISTISDQIIDEDSSTGTLAFVISDAETSVTSLVMSAQSSDTDIIPLSGIQFTGTDGNRTVEITPAADQNTEISGPVTITLIVDDGSDTQETSFDVTINPINDSPNFTIESESIIWPPGTVGNQNYQDFIQNIIFGPTDDENISQGVEQFIINVTGDDIFDSLASDKPQLNYSELSNTADLTYRLTGVAGTATVEVSLQDDAGGDDTSGVQSFTITVEAPIN